MILIAGLSHVPHVYLYVSSAMRNLPSDLEEAAHDRCLLWQVSRDVTVPMVLPALIFAASLNILLGFETFGIPLVLGDPNGIMVLTTYIYKLTTLFGTPTYQLMAVVAVVLVLITLPLVWMQRRLLRNARKYAAMGGKGARVSTLKLGTSGQVIALSIIGFWLFVSVVLPIGGIAVRAFVMPGVRASIFGTSLPFRTSTNARSPEPRARHHQHGASLRGRRRRCSRHLSDGRPCRAPQLRGACRTPCSTTSCSFRAPCRA